MSVDLYFAIELIAACADGACVRGRFDIDFWVGEMNLEQVA